MFVIYTLDPKECASCNNALPHLKTLKSRMLEDKTSLYFVDCDKHQAVCKSQKVSGFPTLFAYKIIQSDDKSCVIDDKNLSVILYHGIHQSSHLLNWYHDVKDLGIHYETPHEFHEGCNIHLTITTTSKSTDEIHLECMKVICKEILYSECFILQPDKESDVYISSVTLGRRGGVSSVIYEDGVHLDVSFERTQHLHQYHGHHHHGNPVCSENQAGCLTRIKVFIKEHSRVPVTELSPILFHSPTSYNPLFGDLPVLVALLDHETINKDGGFMKILEKVSIKYYKDLATSYVNVDRYPMWVFGMSPTSTVPFDKNSWVFTYPRVIIFQLNNHKEASFLRTVGRDLQEDDVTKFIDSFLKSRNTEPCNGI